MGGSAALISIKMLSISKPTKAAKTCSVVFNLTPSFSRVVPLCVLTTYFARASISGLSPKSTLLNNIPLYSSPGNIVTFEFLPECSPIPLKEIGF